MSTHHPTHDYRKLKYNDWYKSRIEQKSKKEEEHGREKQKDRLCKPGTNRQAQQGKSSRQINHHADQ